MYVLRAAVVCLLVASCAACTSFAETAECGSPRLVAMSGAATAPLTTEPAIELWGSDGESQVLTDDRAASSPAMSPDGETVAVALGEGEWSDAQGWDASRVALISVDSGEVTVLSSEVPGTEVAFLEWSTSGVEIAFLRFGAGSREIVAINVETGEERRVLPVSERQGDFAWSPNGTEMIIPTRVLVDGGSTVELRRYFLGSGHHIVVTAVETGIREPSWSPDGRWVALQTLVPETDRLRPLVLDVESGEQIPVDLRQGAPRAMTWSGPFLIYFYGLGDAPDYHLMSWDSRTLRRSTVDRAGIDRFVENPISAPRCESASL
jgi:dipeptidyl aminopeptidase/acylaminoacyl peptidase